ncbi:Hint domain-containing protein [Cribrihabitans neustonicus]|uniref:Hint domain-containing protein n=1 Tax=Cribrihabitans neustonicus TaxID=1429085 RepID=UPI003B592B5D
MKSFASAPQRTLPSPPPFLRQFLGAQSVSLPAGTLVEGRAGSCPVEDLRPGSLVASRRGEARIAAVRCRQALLQAVEFAAGEDSGAPALIVPWDQKLLIHGRRAQALFGQPQAVVPAYELADAEGARDLGLQMLTLHILEFDRPHVIYAGGMELAAAQANDGMRPAA